MAWFELDVIREQHNNLYFVAILACLAPFSVRKGSENSGFKHHSPPKKKKQWQTLADA